MRQPTGEAFQCLGADDQLNSQNASGKQKIIKKMSLSSANWQSKRLTCEFSNELLDTLRNDEFV
jgi:hypothetical protein